MMEEGTPCSSSSRATEEPEGFGRDGSMDGDDGMEVDDGEGRSGGEKGFMDRG
jgi:hypothetical protein